MFIHLIAQDDDLAVVGEFLELLHVGLAHHRTRWVVRRVDDDHLGAACDAFLHLVPIDAVFGRFELDINRHAAVELDGGHIAVVSGFEHDHLVAFADDGGDSRIDGLRGPRSDVDLVGGMIANAIQRLHLSRNGFAKLHHPLHRGILVHALFHVLINQLHQLLRTLKIREALGEVDGFVLVSKLRHHRKNGGAYFG